MKEWNDKLTYRSETIAKMLQEAEEKKQEENTEKAETVSIVSTPTPYKLEPSPSSYVIAVEGKHS